MQQCSEDLQAVVHEDWAGQRLDSFWADQLQPRNISRSRISKWIKKGQARLNGQICRRPAARLEAGDELQLEIPVHEEHIDPQPGNVHILHEDSHLLVLNKQAGLAVHPAESCRAKTLVHYLLYRFPELQELDPVRPGIVHRLDKDTSGLMLVARSQESSQALARDLAQRRVRKEYLTLVRGCPGQDLEWIDQPLGRDPVSKVKMKVLPENGRRARTWYRVLQRFEHKDCSLLQVGIETGRTHQIRVHLAHAGHPVLGDTTYGKKAWQDLQKEYPVLNKICPRQMLHAWQLELQHPDGSGSLNFLQPVPTDFYRVLLFLYNRPQLLGITGAVGCGKSALTGLLARSNIPVWIADQIVAAFYEPYADGWEMLRRHFGNRFLVSEQGPVDKQKLFQAMQQSQALKDEILSLIHPLVSHHLHNFLHEHKHARLVAAEVPLLLESGWQNNFDVVLGIYVPNEVRRQWLARHRGWSEEQVRSMEAWQLPQEKKMQGVHLVLENPGDWAGLEHRVRGLLKVLRILRRRRMQRCRQNLKQQKII